MTGTMKQKLVYGTVVMAVALVAAMPGVSAQNAPFEEFTAFAINTNSRTRMPGDSRPARATTAQLTIRIERWSTDAERDTLLEIIKGEQNINRMNQALLRAVQRLPRVGTIRESGTLAWDLRFARQTKLDEGGRQIVLGTDYPFPWTRTAVDHILGTPGLTDAERAAMLGETAAKLLGITA